MIPSAAVGCKPMLASRYGEPVLKTARASVPHRFDSAPSGALKLTVADVYTSLL